MDQLPLTRRQLFTSVGAVSGLGGVAGIGIATAGPDPTFEATTPHRGAWSMPRYGPRNTAHNPHAAPPQTPPTAAWTAVAPGTTALAVANGTVFAGSDGRGDRSSKGIVAFEATTGQQRWSDPAGATSICVHDGTMYAVSERDGSVTALDATTGKIRWQVTASSSVGHFLLPGADALYVGFHGWLAAYDPETGEKRWRRNVGGQGRVGMGIAHERLYASGPGPLYAFEPREGLDALLHKPPQLGWQAGKTAIGFDFAPVLTDDIALTGGRHPTEATQTATAYNTATGSTLWTTSPLGNVVSTPAIAANHGFIGTGMWEDDSATGAVVALDLQTGNVRWRHSITDGATPPIVANGVVFGATYANHRAAVYALDATTGKKLWTRRLKGRMPNLVAVDQTLYVGTEGGTVVALRRH